MKTKKQINKNFGGEKMKKSIKIEFDKKYTFRLTNESLYTEFMKIKNNIRLIIYEDDSFKILEDIAESKKENMIELFYARYNILIKF